MPSSSAMPPAMASITRLNELRAIDARYTSSMVRTRARGRSGLIDQTACRICFIRLSEPARLVRSAKTAPRWAKFALPQKLFIKIGQ